MQMAKETEDYELDRDTITSGISAVFDDPNKGKYFLALNENDEFMGMLLTMTEWSDWRNKYVMWIHSVYVKPEFRKDGVFKELYCHLKNMVSASDEYAGLRLYVDKTNQNATKVYQKLGMTDQHYNLFEWLK